MSYKENKAQRESLIEMILGATPYTKESTKYQIMSKDLRKLQWDTLLILRQSQKGSALTDQEVELLAKGS